MSVMPLEATGDVVANAT